MFYKTILDSVLTQNSVFFLSVGQPWTAVRLQKGGRESERLGKQLEQKIQKQIRGNAVPRPPVAVRTDQV